MFETYDQLLHFILRLDLEFDKILAKLLCCLVTITHCVSREIDNE